MSNRELVLDVVRQLPEDAPIEEILERIAFVAGVNQAIAEADRGEGYSIEEVKEMIKAWDTESS